MGYFLISGGENAVPAASLAPPKMHTPFLPVKERGHRYYQPELGRWCSRDPVKDRQSANLYAMNENCPITAVDPLGEWSCTSQEVNLCQRACYLDWREYKGCSIWIVIPIPVWPPPCYREYRWVHCSCAKKVCFFVSSSISLTNPKMLDCHYTCEKFRSKTIQAPVAEGCPAITID